MDPDGLSQGRQEPDLGRAQARRRQRPGSQARQRRRLRNLHVQPARGESIYFDNIRLSMTKAEEPPGKKSFAVAGTDWVLNGVNSSGVLSAGAVMELGKKLDVGWTAIEDRTVAQLEEEFAAQYGELKKKHPRAVLTILRDGEKGYDPDSSGQDLRGLEGCLFFEPRARRHVSHARREPRSGRDAGNLHAPSQPAHARGPVEHSDGLANPGGSADRRPRHRAIATPGKIPPCGSSNRATARGRKTR